jgi:hypothetical protein
LDKRSRSREFVGGAKAIGGGDGAQSVKLGYFTGNPDFRQFGEIAGATGEDVIAVKYYQETCCGNSIASQMSSTFTSGSSPGDAW